jgi:hypothetical protein
VATKTTEKFYIVNAKGKRMSLGMTTFFDANDALRIWLQDSYYAHHAEGPLGIMKETRTVTTKIQRY